MSKVIDETVVAELKELLADGFPILVERFASDGAERLSKMEQALSGGDANLLYNEAHGLKGSSRNVGAIMLAEHCGELESMGHKQDLAGATAVFAAAQAEFADVNTALHSLL